MDFVNAMNERDSEKEAGGDTMPGAYRDGHSIRHTAETSDLEKLKNHRVRHGVFRVVNAEGCEELDRLWDRIIEGECVMCSEEKKLEEGTLIIAMKWMEPRGEAKKADSPTKLVEKPAVLPGEDTKG